MTGNDHIMLSHGSGGSRMHQLIEELFIAGFSNQVLNSKADSAILPERAGQLAFTTDSFVVDPLFFPGGDIGKLAVCGTVNDLVAARAVPCCLSAGFIIEEGFPIKELGRIVASMAGEAARAGVFVATGDTKVVEKGKCDKLFINTSGIGYIPDHHGSDNKEENQIIPGDQVIVTGYIADHGMAVMAARNRMSDGIDFQSDCASLNKLLEGICDVPGGIKFMRDPTRGGLATTLCELAGETGLGILIREEMIPVRPAVRGFCDLLGFDPLYVANEGKMVIVTQHDKAELLLNRLKSHPLGMEASIIGEVTTEHGGMVRMVTQIGGTRIINMLSGEQLPRIC